MKELQALFFPYMHPEFVDQDIPDGVFFLDPGIAAKRGYSSCFLQPENLVLNEKDALKYVQDCLSFGEQFRDPKDISYLLAANLERFEQETSTQIKSMLTRSNEGFQISEEEENKQVFSQAQMALLLAWTFEERLLEYKKLQQGINDQWENLFQELGVEDEAGVHLPGSDVGFSKELLSMHRELDWLQILPWFLLFAGEFGLFVLDSEIRKQWEEQGLVFQKFSADYPGIYHTYAYGYELILQNKELADRHWMKEKYHVFFQS